MRLVPNIHLSMLPQIPLGVAMPEASRESVLDQRLSKAQERLAYDRLRDAQAREESVSAA